MESKEETTEKKRKHIFKHRKLLEYTAETIVSTRPTSQIVYNTLKGNYETAFSEGYITRIDDSAVFKAKQEERRKTSWNSVKDYLSDLISKEKPVEQSNNQPKE
jgi:hypothetical protein